MLRRLLLGSYRHILQTYHFDELCQFEFEPDSDGLRVVDDGPDESVVVAQQVVVQPLRIRIRFYLLYTCHNQLF